MYSINEIAKWHPLSLQKWLREIEEEDLILVMAHLPDGVRHLIMENLSSRLRTLVNKSMRSTPKLVSKKTIDKAQARILEAANDLIDIGELSEPGEEDLNTKEILTTTLPPVLSSQNTKELIDTVITLSNYAKERGIVSLEEALPKIRDPFLKEAIQLVIDGTDPDATQEILKNRVEALNYYRDLLYSIMIEGLLGIQAGDSTWLIETKVRSYLPPEIGQKE